jgi:hypothetical protein
MTCDQVALPTFSVDSMVGRFHAVAVWRPAASYTREDFGPLDLI